MKKVIAEIIKRNLYIKLYFGTEPNIFCADDFPGYSDCAIMNIKMVGVNVVSFKTANPEQTFIREIENKKNILRFHNTIINEKTNVSCIDLEIKIKSRVQLIKRNLS